jgi:aryl-alcohol dehydrogenase-like predicted oxidoreductase
LSTIEKVPIAKPQRSQLNIIEGIPIEGSQRLPKKPQPFLESNSLSKEAKLPLNQGQLTKQKLGKERARKNSKTKRKEEQQHNSKTRQAQNSKESSQHATQCIDNIN